LFADKGPTICFSGKNNLNYQLRLPAIPNVSFSSKQKNCQAFQELLYDYAKWTVQRKFNTGNFEAFSADCRQ